MTKKKARKKAKKKVVRFHPDMAKQQEDIEREIAETKKKKEEKDA